VEGRRWRRWKREEDGIKEESKIDKDFFFLKKKEDP
jgi:hypothetical protein